MRLTELVGALDEVELAGDLSRGAAGGAGVEDVEDVADVEVAGIRYDSRAVAPGDLFCALPGAHHDGAEFARDAVAAGAVAVLTEGRTPVDVPQLLVPDARHATGLVAAAFHGRPSEALVTVGVTGTNGKTTTTHLLAHLLRHAGRPTGVIGTLTGARTTPEAPDLQARLRELVDEGAVAVAMEVSSHALALRRVDGTRFDVAVFTNLSRDHLDFHASMEEYFHAKARLFRPELADRALVNVDDPYGRLLLEAATVPTRGYGLEQVSDLDLRVTSSTFRWRDRRVDLPLGGAFNVSNALAALESAIELGVDPDVLAPGLASAPPVPGRFEPVDRGQPFAVVVDYAHTPDGLEQVLASARTLSDGGRVLVVFGCGGERDVTKRPVMGEVASRLADRVYLTSDNPRGEDPQEIIDDVKAGMLVTDALVVDADRRSAIAAAVADAAPGDVVVIAGKGHETTQTIGGVARPFDDRQVAAEVLDERERSRS